MAMGFGGSWMAVRCAREAALAALGLEAERPVDDIPARLSVADLPEGWTLFLSSDMDEALEDRMVELSRLGPAVGCAMEEHVMFHEARGFIGGREVWRITRDSEEGDDHLQASGEVPAHFESIRQAAIARQRERNDADYLFDVPADVAKAICGFKFGDDRPEGGFTELRRPRPPKTERPGLLARLFGGR
jgi:hypothetical protein